MIKMGVILDAELVEIQCEKGDFTLVQGVKHCTKSTSKFKNLGYGMGGESTPARIEVLAKVTTKDGTKCVHRISARQSFRAHYPKFTQKILDKIKKHAPKKFQVEVRQNSKGDNYFAIEDSSLHAWVQRVK